MRSYELTSEQSKAIQSVVNSVDEQTPSAIAGPVGSGKTLVATEIAVQLASQTKIDFEQNGSSQSVYFVTHTNRLKNFVTEQIEELVGPGQTAVEVKTVHTFLMDYLKVYLKDYLEDYLKKDGFVDCKFCSSGERKKVH